jgi:uncharacterized repeat protein (TIGR02543 family)
MGSFAPITAYIGDTVTLPSVDDFSFAGYVLLGAHEDGGASSFRFNGESFVLDVAQIALLFGTGGSTTTEVVLFAIWGDTEDAFSDLLLIYDANGGIGNVPATSGGHIPGDSVSLVGNIGNPPLSRAGYVFDGWEQATTATGRAAVSSVTFGDSDITVYARWIAEQEASYTVTVNASHATASGAGTYVQGSIVTIDAGIRQGYRFSGWTVVSGGVVLGNAANTRTSFVMPAADVTITATWQQDSSGGGGSSGGSGSGKPATGDTGGMQVAGALALLALSGAGEGVLLMGERRRRRRRTTT